MVIRKLVYVALLLLISSSVAFALTVSTETYTWEFKPEIDVKYGYNFDIGTSGVEGTFKADSFIEYGAEGDLFRGSLYFEDLAVHFALDDPGSYNAATDLSVDYFAIEGRGYVGPLYWVGFSGSQNWYKGGEDALRVFDDSVTGVIEESIVDAGASLGTDGAPITDSTAALNNGLKIGFLLDNVFDVYIATTADSSRQLVSNGSPGGLDDLIGAGPDGIIGTDDDTNLSTPLALGLGFELLFLEGLQVKVDAAWRMGEKEAGILVAGDEIGVALKVGYAIPIGGTFYIAPQLAGNFIYGSNYAADADITKRLFSNANGEYIGLDSSNTVLSPFSARGEVGVIFGWGDLYQESVDNLDFTGQHFEQLTTGISLSGYFLYTPHPGITSLPVSVIGGKLALYENNFFLPGLEVGAVVDFSYTLGFGNQNLAGITGLAVLDADGNPVTGASTFSVTQNNSMSAGAALEVDYNILDTGVKPYIGAIFEWIDITADAYVVDSVTLTDTSDMRLKARAGVAYYGIKNMTVDLRWDSGDLLGTAPTRGTYQNNSTYSLGQTDAQYGFIRLGAEFYL